MEPLTQVAPALALIWIEDLDFQYQRILRVIETNDICSPRRRIGLRERKIQTSIKECFPQHTIEVRFT